ncbi:hypothetical protein INT47_012340 [Mucor saturninus]|uniref:CAP-Gly domain-containing protein n=1 Tax=Mucor saturninus TaxID=64648 RepID=A0A8H7QXF4_9FUNG|nr:hypothetical protein INT47_012340 [Mucor saturninus]
MSTKLKLPSIPVRTPKNRFQSDIEEANKIGQRVTIPSLDNCTGILRYVGEPDFKSGVWAGIELDKQGEGKNDGSVQGKRYFQCAPNTGIFIGVNKIIIHPPALPTMKKKPSPTSSTTRKSNLPLTRNPSHSTRILNSSSSSSTTTTSSQSTKMRAHGLRISSVPTTVSSSSAATTTAPAMTRKKSTPSPAMTTTTVPVIPHSPTPPPPLSVVQTPPPAQTPPPSVTPTPPPPAAAAATISTSTAAAVAAAEEKHQQETNQLYEMLEKVQRERDSFQQQMKSKETAWERLVSSKESLVIQVEERDATNRRLQSEWDALTTRMEGLEGELAERDATIAKFQRDEEKTSQDGRRIERLDHLVRELQAQVKGQMEEAVLKGREYQGSMDQVRKEVTASESLNAALEKECQELRLAGLEAMHAYEDSVHAITTKHAHQLEEKDAQIARLEYIIADLKHKQSTLFDDDELDIETRLKELSQSNSSSDQTHRLEEQLELTMAELDSERRTIATIVHECDGLKLELKAARQQCVTTEQKYGALQADFEKELADKKKLMEEADSAFERQAKAEDEHYQSKLSTMALEKEYNALLESHKQLESEYSKLMDEMMVLEKQDASPDAGIREKFQALENERDTLTKHLAEKSTQVKQLCKDLAELENLVENRVFGESELEEELELERKKVISLSRELNEVKSSHGRNSFKNMLISPTTTSTTSSPTPSHGNDDLSRYCEICERYGHDLLQCKNTTAATAAAAAAAKMVSFIDTHYAYINNLTNYFF